MINFINNWLLLSNNTLINLYNITSISKKDYNKNSDSYQNCFSILANDSITIFSSNNDSDRDLAFNTIVSLLSQKS